MSDSLITSNLVSLDVDFDTTPRDVITHLADTVAAAGRSSDAAQLAADAYERESKAGTGVNGQVAIPHCRSAAVSQPTLAFARLSRPVDFGGPDGDAELVFLIAAPEGGGKEHMKILSKLARALVRGDFIDKLRAASTNDDIVEAVLAVTNAEKKSSKSTSTAAAPSTPAETAPAPASVAPTIVAVTACPTGIAHTYMAADALQQAADKREDVHLVVETQGSSGGEQLDPAIIEKAEAVIFAVDVAVRDKERFAGKPFIQTPVKRGINEPDAMLDEALAAAKDPNARRVVADGTASSAQSGSSSSEESWPKRIQQAVMTGVSYMVPFVAAGGLLLALGFLIGGYDVANGWQAISTGYSLSNLPGNEVLVDGATVVFDRSGLALYLGAVMFAIGQAAMGFVVAALSGYTAFSLAGRPGIAPGFVGGAISVMLGAGFIGGLITGILAGVVAHWIGNWKVPAWLRSLMPVVIIPLLTSLIVGLAMFLLLGRPLEALMTGLTDWLNSMSGSSAILLGLIIGLMMCLDLGGPVNKAAYLFGTAGLSAGTEASYQIMAAVMLAGMVPPIALSIATFIRKQLFTPAEQENGKSAWLLGLSFVSEGAIPFAAADPLRVIPSMMAGGAVTGAVSMALGVGSRAPHGGIFVLFAINPWWGALIALAAGIATSTVAVLALKQFWPNRAVEEAAENGVHNNSQESSAVTA
ncbi:PTS fructose transporter subunit IIABC [Corynebacterium pilosum]|uniref:Phosphotransferase system, fructose-specific IIC component n=1 Tax=Corynebacterium pilosum TaxID=35756 RepID=A0A376CQY8_9CORY|nr:fructose-specific PTS transporter subunit EIIC [Corynebacterium pilosum]STC70627.1 phosphotransferase system, fructose-specific IIC component [Corynebacterium pilosum]